MCVHPQAQITLTCLSFETQMCRVCYPHFIHNVMIHFTCVYACMWCSMCCEWVQVTLKSLFTSFADPSTEDLGQHCHWVRPTNTVCAGPKCASSNPSPPHPCKAQHAKGTLCCVHCLHTYMYITSVCALSSISWAQEAAWTVSNITAGQPHQIQVSFCFLWLLLHFTTHNNTYVCTSNERYQFCTGNHWSWTDPTANQYSTEG